MLLYIRGEGGVGKSRVVQALELGFNFLGRQAELVISLRLRVMQQMELVEVPFIPPWKLILGRERALLLEQIHFGHKSFLLLLTKSV